MRNFYGFSNIDGGIVSDINITYYPLEFIVLVCLLHLVGMVENKIYRHKYKKFS